MIDGRQIQSGLLTHITKPLKLKHDSAFEELPMYPTGLGRHALILGLLWLRKHNPSVNWNSGTISFTQLLEKPAQFAANPIDVSIQMISMSEAKDLLNSNQAHCWIMEAQFDESGSVSMPSKPNQHTTYLPSSKTSFLSFQRQPPPGCRSTDRTTTRCPYSRARGLLRHRCP